MNSSLFKHAACILEKFWLVHAVFLQLIKKTRPFVHKKYAQKVSF